MKKLAERTRRVVAIFPTDLYERLVQRAARESADRKKSTTPSQIIRWAVEEYMDTWENATFVPDPKGE